jgi:hypothetical protein
MPRGRTCLKVGKHGGHGGAVLPGRGAEFFHYRVVHFAGWVLQHLHRQGSAVAPFWRGLYAGASRQPGDTPRPQTGTGCESRSVRHTTPYPQPQQVKYYHGGRTRECSGRGRAQSRLCGGVATPQHNSPKNTLERTRSSECVVATGAHRQAAWGNALHRTCVACIGERQGPCRGIAHLWRRHPVRHCPHWRGLTDWLLPVQTISWSRRLPPPSLLACSGDGLHARAVCGRSFLRVCFAGEGGGGLAPRRSVAGAPAPPPPRSDGCSKPGEVTVVAARLFPAPTPRALLPAPRPVCLRVQVLLRKAGV